MSKGQSDVERDKLTLRSFLKATHKLKMTESGETIILVDGKPPTDLDKGLSTYSLLIVVEKDKKREPKTATPRFKRHF